MPLSAPHSVYYIRSEPGPDGTAEDSKTHRLVLTTTSLRNVVLANQTDVLYYEVVTPRWERHITRVSRLDVNTRCFDLVAELLNGHQRDPAHANTNTDTDRDAAEITGQDKAGGTGRRLEEDTKRVVALRFHGMGEPRAAEEFLHTEAVGRHPDELRAWFRAKDGRKYTWWADKTRLELTRENDPDKPVVSFHKEKRHLHVLRMSQHPYLEVHPSVLDSLDYIIVSFLLIQRLRREFGLG